MITEKIYCCACEKEVEAHLTSGQGVFPELSEDQRSNLWHLPFWRCPACKNFVGCKKNQNNPLIPAGIIQTKELREACGHLRKLVFPLWKDHKEPFRARGWINRFLAKQIGKSSLVLEQIKTTEEVREIYKIALTIKSAEDCRNVAEASN